MSVVTDEAERLKKELMLSDDVQWCLNGKVYSREAVNDALSFWEGEWIESDFPVPKWFTPFHDWLKGLCLRSLIGDK